MESDLESSEQSKLDILIVENSRTMRQMVKGALKETPFSLGRIETANDGDEALQTLKSGYEPDVILSDWKMPNMDGFDFLEAVRLGYPDLPFGFVTSQRSEQLSKEAQKAGADFFIAKPFTAERLAKALEPYI